MCRLPRPAWVSLAVFVASAFFLGLATGDGPHAPAQPPPAKPPDDPSLRNTQPGEPLSAQQALAGMTTLDGFQVDLVAAEPMVVQPIALTFDDQGRMWVAECLSYAERPTNYDRDQRDRIVILHDDDRDGKADRRQVVWDQAQKLTSVAVGFGGVWATCAPHLLFLPDHDGDGVLDGPPEIVLDGFNDGAVRHNIVNGLKFGPDGWLYGRHGIQAFSEVGVPGTPRDQRIPLSRCIWRIHPIDRRFEVVCEGTTNPWGHDWDDHGHLFFINTVIGHLWHAIPGAHFKRMYGEDIHPFIYELIDQHADHYHWDTSQTWSDSRNTSGIHGQLGGGHAHVGMMIYLGDAWPEEYRGELFTLNFHGRRINQEHLERRGCGFVARHRPDFLFAADPWFRGIDLTYTPDGSVVMLDWSDTGECHEDDGVHRTSGRIYRISHRDFTSRSRPAFNLRDEPDARLLERLAEPNDWFGRAARRLLQERAHAGTLDPRTIPALRALLADHPEERMRLRALWCLHSINALTTERLHAALNDSGEHLRSWAVRLLAERGAAEHPEIGAALLDRARRDPSGLVRLELASALQRLGPDLRFELGAALMERSEDRDDHNQPLMVWYGMEPVVSAAPGKGVELIKRGAFPKVARLIARRLAADLDQPAFGQAVAQLIALAASQPIETRAAVLEGMAQALRGRRRAPVPEGWETHRDALARSGDNALNNHARELDLLFGSGRALADLRAVALDETAPSEARRDALRSLIDADYPEKYQDLFKLATDLATAGLAARGLAAFDHPEVAERILKRFHVFRPEDRPMALDALVSRPSWAMTLLEAIAQGRVPRADLNAGHARLILSHNQPELKAKLAEVWGELRETPADKAEAIARYRALLTPESLQTADLKRGRTLYTQTCGACHKLFGEGGAIGPELTGADRQTLDYWLANLIDPSAVVPAGYVMSVVLMNDGRVLNGIVASRSGSVVVLQTASERIHLDAEDVEEIQPTGQSLMPEGQLTALTDEEARDLIGYLMSSGPN